MFLSCSKDAVNNVNPDYYEEEHFTEEIYDIILAPNIKDGILEFKNSTDFYVALKILDTINLGSRKNWV